MDRQPQLTKQTFDCPTQTTNSQIKTIFKAIFRIQLNICDGGFCENS